MVLENPGSKNSHSNSKSGSTIYDHIYQDGVAIGKFLKEGDISSYTTQLLQLLEEFKTIATKFVGNPDDILSRMSIELVRGIQSTDPTDVHITERETGINFYVDAKGEELVNDTFGILDRFSNKPQHDYKQGISETPETAVDEANSALRQPASRKLLDEDSVVAGDFVADFNRRKLENNWLPNFEAYLDTDGYPKIRYLK
jgi:hypothetical protein